MTTGHGARTRMTSPGRQVQLYHPTAAHPYFRMVWQDPETGQRRFTSAGRDLVAATKRAEDLERRLLSADPDAFRARTFGDLVDAYVDPARPKFDSPDRRDRSWSDGYTTSITRRAQRIRERIGNLKLEVVSQRHMHALVNSEATYHQASAMRTTLRAMVKFGVERGFLRSEQSHLARVDIMVQPGVRHRTPAPPEQGEDPQLLAAAEVPTVEAVKALSLAPVPYPHWRGLVELLCFCGPRIHEALALTDVDVTRDARHPLPHLRIERQLIERRGGGVTLSAPKNRHARTVSIISTTSTQFELADWLLSRAEEARAERLGDLPALLFPSPRSRTYWRLRNLRKRVFVPAAEHAGWAYRDIQAPSVWRGRDGLIRGECTHRVWEHTIHSLRHFFATTAIDEWGWRDDELCLAGGWQSEEFVRRRYYGKTTQVTAVAQQKQLRWLNRLAGPDGSPLSDGSPDSLGGVEQ